MTQLDPQMQKALVALLLERMRAPIPPPVQPGVVRQAQQTQLQEDKLARKEQKQLEMQRRRERKLLRAKIRQEVAARSAPSGPGSATLPSAVPSVPGVGSSAASRTSYSSRPGIAPVAPRVPILPSPGMPLASPMPGMNMQWGFSMPNQGMPLPPLSGGGSGFPMMIPPIGMGNGMGGQYLGGSLPPMMDNRYPPPPLMQSSGRFLPAGSSTLPGLNNLMPSHAPSSTVYFPPPPAPAQLPSPQPPVQNKQTGPKTVIDLDEDTN